MNLRFGALSLSLCSLFACGEEEQGPLNVTVSLSSCLGTPPALGPQSACRSALHPNLKEGINGGFAIKREVEDAGLAESYFIPLHYEKGSGYLEPRGEAVIPVAPGFVMQASLFLFGSGFTEADCKAGTWDYKTRCTGPCLIRLDEPSQTVEADGLRAIFDFKEDNGPCFSTLPDIPWAEEDCDGLDNDCDGSIDEDLDAPNTSNHLGVCTEMRQICHGVEGWKDPPEIFNRPDETAEECDGKDNNCDGLIDKNLGKPLITRYCYTGTPGTDGVGVCVGGLETCKFGQENGKNWGDCEGQKTPTVEICSEISRDEDCNGVTDTDAAQLISDESN